MQAHKVIVKARKEDGRWIIRIEGVTSGFKVHVNDCDDAVVEFGLDASRFFPAFQVPS